MDNRVGGTADRHVGGDRVFKRSFGENIARLQIFRPFRQSGGRRRSPCASDWHRRRESTKLPAKSYPSSRRSMSSSKRCPSSCSVRENGQCRLRSLTIHSR